MDDDSSGATDFRLLDELIAQLRDGTLDLEGVVRLEEWVVRDPAACWHYVQSMNLDAGLAWHYSGPHDRATSEGTAAQETAAEGTSDGAAASRAAAMPILGAPIGSPSDANPATHRAGFPLFKLNWPTSPGSWTAVVTGLGLLLAVSALLSWSIIRSRGVDRHSGIVVAELQSDQGCAWAGARREIAVGDRLYSGERLELTAGVAKLLFQKGTTVVIESPAAFELASSTSMRLEQGTVAVRVNGPKKEFVVVSPDASIVDLGTSFGVHADQDGTTDVEVFEGAVEVQTRTDSDNGQVLGLGASARVHHVGPKTHVDVVASPNDRFGNLLEVLWADISKDPEGGARDGDDAIVQAEFKDAPIPNSIDTFYGAVPGRGWLTPWMASGNPLGEVRKEDPLAGADDPYLRVRFIRSYERTVARAYGARRGFDPAQPHLISWRWRLDGDLDHPRDGFRDRVCFYGNPFFRRNSRPTNSWLIGVAGGNETVGDKRGVYPMHWYAFDGGEGEDAKVFDRRNMVDTGMTLKRGVVYRFAVAVYPQQARYDVAIRDDERTFVRTGLKYRNQTPGPANVLHFGIGTSDAGDDRSFSLDSVWIKPLEEGALRREIEDQKNTTEAD